MEFDTIRECFILFLKLLGKQKMILDLPDEREARTYELEQIRSMVQIFYTASLVSLPVHQKASHEILVITTIYRQLMKMMKDYQGNKMDYYESKIEELEIEIAKLTDENSFLNQELENSALRLEKELEKERKQKREPEQEKHHVRMIRIESSGDIDSNVISEKNDQQQSQQTTDESKSGRSSWFSFGK